MESDTLSPKDVTTFTTSYGKILAICYDRASRIGPNHDHAGAEVIICPARLTRLPVPALGDLARARAVDNQVFILAASPYPGGVYPAYGHWDGLDPWGGDRRGG